MDSRGEEVHSVLCLPGGLPHCLTGCEMACGPPTIFQREPYHSSRHHWLWYTSCRAVPKERKFTELLMQFSTTTCFPIPTCSPTLLFSYSYRIIHVIFFNYYMSPCPARLSLPFLLLSLQLNCPYLWGGPLHRNLASTGLVICIIYQIPCQSKISNLEWNENHVFLEWNEKQTSQAL